jgi:hypothetical protein
MWLPTRMLEPQTARRSVNPPMIWTPASSHHRRCLIQAIALFVLRTCCGVRVTGSLFVEPTNARIQGRGTLPPGFSAHMTVQVMLLPSVLTMQVMHEGAHYITEIDSLVHQTWKVKRLRPHFLRYYRSSAHLHQLLPYCAHCKYGPVLPRSVYVNCEQMTWGLCMPTLCLF